MPIFAWFCEGSYNARCNKWQDWTSQIARLGVQISFDLNDKSREKPVESGRSREGSCMLIFGVPNSSFPENVSYSTIFSETKAVRFGERNFCCPGPDIVVGARRTQAVAAFTKTTQLLFSAFHLQCTRNRYYDCPCLTALLCNPYLTPGPHFVLRVLNRRCQPLLPCHGTSLKPGQHLTRETC